MRSIYYPLRSLRMVLIMSQPGKRLFSGITLLLLPEQDLLLAPAIAIIFALYPGAVLPVWLEIPIAMLLGFYGLPERKELSFLEHHCSNYNVYHRCDRKLCPGANE